MKVKELIELLNTFNQDLEIETRDECGSFQELKEDYVYETSRSKKDKSLVLVIDA